MAQLMKILLVEDNENDAELIRINLMDANCDVEITRVETESQMEASLKDKDFDIILSDYTLPTFSGPAALETLLESGLDIPFVVVSGTISLERAIAMMKRGASDFVLKDQLPRLAPVVQREARESKNRSEKRAAEDRYKQIVETAHEGIGLADGSGKILFANCYLAGLFKKSVEDLQGEVIHDLLWDVTEKRFESFLQETSFRKKKFSNLDFKFRRSDGRELWAMVSLSSVSGKEGAQTLIIMSDVTQRKKDEEEKRWLVDELQSALQARDEFLSVVSHELKTPLTPLMLQIDLLNEFLLEGPPEQWDKNEIKKALKLMMDHLNKLKTLVEELLEVTRFRAGKYKVKKEKANFTSLTKSILEKFELQLKHAECPVTFNAPEELEGDFDPGQMEVVVTNLLTNAMKYGRGCPIDINLSGDEEVIRLSIKDRGIGIDIDQQKRIFERFERAASHTRFGGLGLGLYISGHIVKAHKGAISVVSEKGKGATFIVEVPRHEKKEIAPSENVFRDSLS